MPKILPSNPTNRVREIRNQRGLSQEELALQADIGLTTLRKIESNAYQGTVKRVIQEHIAAALDLDVDIVFPSDFSSQAGFNRRQLFGQAGAISSGLALSAFGLSDEDDPFNLQRNRTHLSKEEFQTLIAANVAGWGLFNTLQINSTIDYVMASAKGKLVTLEHLAECSIPGEQKDTIRILLGDMYLLVGRLSRELNNFGECEKYFGMAMSIGRAINNTDLKTAAREYLGYLLTDQEMYATALKNGRAILEEAKGASFPIWAEAQLTAAYALVYTGQYAAAQRIAYEARIAKPGRVGEIRVGNLTNPDIVHSQYAITSKIIAERNDEGVQAAEEGLRNLDREQPDNVQFRARLQIFHATALWQLESIDEAVEETKQSLLNTRAIGSTLNQQRVEKLYTRMLNSPHRKRHSVRELGEMIMMEA